MRIRIAGFAAASSVLAVACGSVVGTNPHASSGSGGSTSMSSGVTGSSGPSSASGVGGNPCFPDSCNGPSSTPASATSGPSSTATGGPIVCGAFDGVAVCPPGSFCQARDARCVVGDSSGLCMPIPDVCDSIAQPTCACNRMIYGNPCLAEQAGHDVSNLGGCTPPPGMFSCGAHFCSQGTQYCVLTGDDTGGPDSYVCTTLPAQCSGANEACSCLATVPCGDRCSQAADGGFTVLCPGG